MILTIQEEIAQLIVLRSLSQKIETILWLPHPITVIVEVPILSLMKSTKIRMKKDVISPWSTMFNNLNQLCFNATLRRKKSYLKWTELMALKPKPVILFWKEESLTKTWPTKTTKSQKWRKKWEKLKFYDILWNKHSYFQH